MVDGVLFSLEFLTPFRPSMRKRVCPAPFSFASLGGTQVVKDWAEVHLPLVEAHPEVLGGLTFEVRKKQLYRQQQQQQQQQQHLSDLNFLEGRQTRQAQCLPLKEHRYLRMVNVPKSRPMVHN